jgi:hypothetical protein
LATESAKVGLAHVTSASKEGLERRQGREDLGRSRCHAVAQDDVRILPRTDHLLRRQRSIALVQTHVRQFTQGSQRLVAEVVAPHARRVREQQLHRAFAS